MMNRKKLFIGGFVSATLAALIAPACLSAFTCEIYGTPAPPTNVSLGTAYSLQVRVDADSSYYAKACAVYSSSSLNGTYTKHGDWSFSGYNQTGVHTFNVANYASGSYWWRGRGWRIPGGTGSYVDSSPIGAFTTP